MKIFYVGLEPYNSRYTLQLTEWNVREFKRLGQEFHLVEGVLDHSPIQTGRVLDVFKRSKWALEQSQELVRLLKEEAISSNDWIFFEDMFHPGIEALLYCFSFMPSTNTPNIGMRCLAQTIDPDDFTQEDMIQSWMRHYEKMVTEEVVVFVASQEMLAHFVIAQWNVFAVVTGLPFNTKEVLERLGEPVRPFSRRPQRVAFASRLDWEKQPEIFLAIAKHVTQNNPSVEFVILSGEVELKSNKKNILDAVKVAEEAGYVKVLKGLSKEQYYKELNNTKVLFNCALQDWVSNTLSEADAIGCEVLFPAYRSFPEALFNSEYNLYVPWSMTDALKKLETMLNRKKRGPFGGKFAERNNKAIENTIKEMQGDQTSVVYLATAQDHRIELTNKILKQF